MIIITILLFILSTTIIFAFLAQEIISQTLTKTQKLPWYEVQGWEVDACSKWGGRTQAENSETFQPAQSYGDMTITLQARKTKSLNETLYEVTYFMESYSATTDYTIKLVNQKTGETKEITKGNLGPESGTTDYWTEYLKEDYTIAEIDYAKGKIIVPIIEVR